MLTSRTKDLLHQLSYGALDETNKAFLEELPADEFITELRVAYPVRFQERLVGRKREVGLARSVLWFQFAAPEATYSLFPAVHWIPVLQRCVFVSAYDNIISEVTLITGIQFQPIRTSADEVVLKAGRGVKLDKTPDGWTIRRRKRRVVSLSVQLLKKRGWKFDAPVPIAPQP